MNWRMAEYVLSAVKPQQCPTAGYPEVALVGRSNVGKSSFINGLTYRTQKKIAHTSSRPGKTQTLNFYGIDQQLFLVDLPGYGFAQVSKELKSGWMPMIERYLKQREELVGLVQLLDIRHSPSSEDKKMHHWLRELGYPLLLVATKADKVSRSHWQRQRTLIRDELQSPVLPIPFSVLHGTGRDEAQRAIEEMLPATQSSDLI